MRIAALLVAAGSGSRFGAETPKQFLTLAGQPVLRHAARALAAHASLLQPVGEVAPIEAALSGLPHLPPVPGGATRQASVRAGLEALVPHAPDVVLVHDAARPIIPEGTIDALLAALAQSPGAIPAVPVADTLKRAADGRIIATVPRAGLFRAQTPQAFRFSVLLEAHRHAASRHPQGDHPQGGHPQGGHPQGDYVQGGQPQSDHPRGDHPRGSHSQAGHSQGTTGPADATDDAALLEAEGLEVAIVPGAEANIKLTYPEDLMRLERALLPTLLPRVGTGFDVHAFARDRPAGRPLVLCGIIIPHDQSLVGHSDADVGLHALCDAIYGALAEGDIGQHFPPSEAAWKDADSARFLTHAAGRIAARGGMLANA
ncbi:MAG: 2-C-methyl-D-erythritol 2,4-cyclodiphosphate synthase, partial [Acetobacteraceae bacterium]